MYASLQQRRGRHPRQVPQEYPHHYHLTVACDSCVGRREAAAGLSRRLLILVVVVVVAAADGVVVPLWRPRGADDDERSLTASVVYQPGRHPMRMVMLPLAATP